jgi:hypothetical protein
VEGDSVEGEVVEGDVAEETIPFFCVTSIPPCSFFDDILQATSRLISPRQATFPYQKGSTTSNPKTRYFK